MSPREDALDIFTWIIGQGYTVAARSVYNGSNFHVRAVKGEIVLVAEGRELGAVLKQVRIDAEKAVPPSRMRR